MLYVICYMLYVICYMLVYCERKKDTTNKYLVLIRLIIFKILSHVLI